LSIKLSPVQAGCEATVTYNHTSLGPEGDSFISSFTADYYEGFMRDWEDRINHFLTHGSILKSTDSQGKGGFFADTDPHCLPTRPAGVRDDRPIPSLIFVQVPCM
jgi:hypothetical protein